MQANESNQQNDRASYFKQNAEFMHGIKVWKGEGRFHFMRSPRPPPFRTDSEIKKYYGEECANVAGSTPSKEGSTFLCEDGIRQGVLPSRISSSLKIRTSFLSGRREG